MATHSSILARRIPWTEEPGGLHRYGVAKSQHDGATKHSSAGGLPKRWESESESRSVVSSSLRPHGHTLHGILQARILEWVACPFSRGSSQPRDRTQVSHIAGGFFTS